MPRGRKPYRKKNDKGAWLKLCPDCNRDLTMEHFSITGKYPQSKCKECNRKYCRERDLAKKYGVSIQQYKDMVKSQLGICKICGGTNQDGRPLFVDHCHSTGAVRGLLCNQCNFGIGSFKDNIDLMYKAIHYLEAHNNNNKA